VRARVGLGVVMRNRAAAFLKGAVCSVVETDRATSTDQSLPQRFARQSDEALAGRNVAATTPWRRTTMQHRLRFWGTLAFVFGIGILAASSVLRPAPRHHQDFDMLDAVAAVQRRSPRFVISEPLPGPDWSQDGILYWCNKPRTLEDLNQFISASAQSVGDPRWNGVVCFKGIRHQPPAHTPGVDGNSRCLRYSTFAAYGDDEMLQEVKDILAAAGFRLAPVR
jgi:hypothetical protein